MRRGRGLNLLMLLLLLLLLVGCCFLDLDNGVSAFLVAPRAMNLNLAAREGWRPSSASLSSIAHSEATGSTGTQGHGSIQFDREEVGAEETVRVEYRPSNDYFREEVISEGGLMFCGGYNGWDGEEDPIMMPLLWQGDGVYTVSVPIPNFAKSVEFCVTDGVRYDLGPGDGLFQLRVTYVREVDARGNIILYRQAEDGSLTKTGMIEQIDPQELERMIDEHMDQVGENLKVDGVISVEEQGAVQVLRSEASIYGESLGLGNMQTSEVRDAFDELDDDDTATLAVADAPRVLERLGIVLQKERMQDLLDRHAGAGAERIQLLRFMDLFAELDEGDEGIEIV